MYIYFITLLSLSSEKDFGCNYHLKESFTGCFSHDFSCESCDWEERISHRNQKSSVAHGQLNKNQEGLRPCARSTWAGGRRSVIHWEKETGIEKEQIRVAMVGEEHLRHAAVTFHHDIWGERRHRWTEQSSLLQPPPPTALCELLPSKTECSPVYSTSDATCNHTKQIHISIICGCFRHVAQIEAQLTGIHSLIHWFVRVIKVSLDTLWGAGLKPTGGGERLKTSRQTCCWCNFMCKDKCGGWMEVEFTSCCHVFSCLQTNFKKLATLELCWGFAAPQWGKILFYVPLIQQ